MSSLVLGQASPEAFLVVIDDINLEATVTNRSDVAAAWINGTTAIDDRHLIVGISTIDKYGNHFIRRHPAFFGNLADPPTSYPAETEAGYTKSHASNFSESKISVDPSPSASATESSIFLPPEIEETGNPSFPSSLAPANFSNPKAPINQPLPPTAATATAFISSAKSSSGTIATLQLCCGNRCLVFSLLYNDGGILDALVNFLFARDRVTLFGTGVRRAGDWLGPPARPDACVQGSTGARRGEGAAGVAAADNSRSARRERREKAIRLQQVRHWNRWPLSENQMVVACLDAYLLSQNGEKLVEITREAFHCYVMCSL